MIKILVVDDQNFTRQALQAILETEPDFEVVGKATSGLEAITYLEKSQVDITIVDLEMPEMNGLTLTKILGERFPETKVVILSSHDDEDNINSAVEAGARGYLLKNTSAQEIGDTIRAVQRGYFQLGPGLFEKLLSHLIQEKEQAAEKLLALQSNYARSLAELEQKIVAQNDAERKEKYLFAGSKQAIKKLEGQINSLRFFVIFLSVIFFVVGVSMLFFN